MQQWIDSAMTIEDDWVKNVEAKKLPGRKMIDEIAFLLSQK